MPLSIKKISKNFGASWLDEIILELATPAAEIYVGHWIHTGDFIRLNLAEIE